MKNILFLHILFLLLTFLLIVPDVYGFEYRIGTSYERMDPELSAIRDLNSDENKLPYYTGSGTASLADLTPFARTILDDADAATVLSTIGALGDVVDDTTPSLGGNLDQNGKLIVEAAETTFTESDTPTPDLANAKQSIIFDDSDDSGTNTISGFSNAVSGVVYRVTFADACFKIDFTGTNFYGHAANDWEPRANDSAFFFTQDGTKCHWIISMPSSIPIDQYYALPFNPYGLSDDSWIGPT